jgi:hypothetical protein
MEIIVILKIKPNIMRERYGDTVYIRRSAQRFSLEHI